MINSSGNNKDNPILPKHFFDTIQAKQTKLQEEVMLHTGKSNPLLASPIRGVPREDGELSRFSTNSLYILSIDISTETNVSRFNAQEQSCFVMFRELII
jgi:hypothetical protein